MNHVISSRAGEELATICNVTGAPVRLKMPARRVVFALNMKSQDKTIASMTLATGDVPTVSDLLPAVARLWQGAREQANLKTDGAVKALQEVIRMLRKWCSHTSYGDTAILDGIGLDDDIDDIDTDEAD